MSEPEALARDRAAAQTLLEEWIQNEALRRHCRSVEIVMRAYAVEFGEDADAWGLVGLLHDFDWERHPTLEEHPGKGEAVLAELGYPEWFRRAILSHAPHTGVVAETPLERHLFASDELTGFIHACALMRPTRLEGMAPKSVRKKLKDKRFAANVSREDITQGAELIERDLDDHIAFIVSALQPHADELGLTPEA
ncbi:MAG: HAD family hydrolase [Thermoleophilia bacterium]|nr:HAD family hydrolase [Thermoleophilia bacterium]